MASENPRPGAKDKMALSNASATMLQEAMLKYGNKAKKADLIAWLVVYEMMTHPERFKDAEVENAIANLKLAGGKFRDKNSRPGAKDTMAVEDRFYFGKDRFAITRQPGSCLYANNTGTDVSGYHAAIKKAIDRGGKFDEDFADIFKLTRSPAGSVCLWSLTWA